MSASTVEPTRYLCAFRARMGATSYAQRMMAADFRFIGRLSSTELEASSQCPWVIKEHVRAISGELMIELVSGSSVRLVILEPSAAHERVSDDN
jgi:hypothetical protein